MSCKRGNVALAVNNHAMGEWTIVIYFSQCAILIDQWNGTEWNGTDWIGSELNRAEWN